MNDDGEGYLSFYLANPLLALAIVSIVVTLATLGTIYLRGSQKTKFRIEMTWRTALNGFFVFLFISSTFTLYKAFEIQRLMPEAAPYMDPRTPEMVSDLVPYATMFCAFWFVFAGVGCWLQYRCFKRLRAPASNKDAPSCI